MDHIHAHSEMMKFNVGEQVLFQPSGRSEITGTEVKYNKKTVTLVTEQGERWNVDPSLLSPQSTQNTRSTNRANIIDIDQGQTA